VVDDYDGTREVIARYLRLLEYRVIQVGSAAECAAAVRRGAPDILLIDFHLPDVTGLQCLRELRASGVESPAVIFTADWQVQALEADITALRGRLVFKLCCLEDVAQWIASALEQRSGGGFGVLEKRPLVPVGD
jgi:CheY-like chemotaxis protein